MDPPGIEHPKEHLDESLSESLLCDTEKLPSPNSNVSKESLDAQLKRNARAEKAEAIRKACDSRDVEALASHAISNGGLLEDGLRKIAWPILLQCEQDFGSLKPSNTLPKHADEEQVDLDVNRAFVYYPTDLSEEGIAEKKEQLLSLITQILRNYPMLCYFQGYHDIVQVFLLVMGSQQAAVAMAQVSLFRIRDYMLRTLSPAIKHLQLIPAIIESADPSLRQHLSHIQPFFADIARLYDFLLAREPVVSIYLFAAMILSRKKELLDIPVDEPEMLHFTLSKLPQPLDLDGHILRAEQLFKDHPPESLPHGMWRNIFRYSVLKTSRGPSQKYNAEEAIRLFEKQNQQIRNEERRKQALEFAWKHRRTMGSVTLAILVGAASFYLRKKGLDASIWAYIGRAQSYLFSFI
ncbi:hypothetical protein N7493_000391 [Penicillium malachiteum]|uniref:Rab-GAP TBC domain-containing protein n=1 Tax=Penicillium malachiteum TaxID=1324776 RepID=A0AAD6HXA6_9EURO|nr:hypothetical protein N7493_000391 [Penicillium malachiteum]